MKTYFKCVFTGICLVAAYPPLVWGMRMMNQPSDRSLYTGQWLSWDFWPSCREPCG